MITDWFTSWMLTVFNRVLDWLPQHESDGLNLPLIDPLVTRLWEVDSLVPIGAPVLAVVSILPFALAFILVRFIVFARNFLLP